MYDEQGMTGVGAMTEFPKMEKNPDAPVPLLGALEDAQMQMEKLIALINEVFVKAAPLMLASDEVMMKPMSPENAVAATRRYASPAAEKADALCAGLRHAQARIARLARELDA
jgi:hypothetical protein